MTAAFDTLAARYDEIWTESPVGRAQRRQVWRELDPLFPAGARILDMGCGTGADAAHFLARGVAVMAFDASPAMVRAALGRGVTATVLRVEEMETLRGSYDGALSNFGALNCVSDLSGVAVDLGRLIRPGGTVALCTLGRFCAWESLYYVVRGQFRKAARRWRGSAASSLGIDVRYPGVAELAAAFAPEFELRRWKGIGLAVPPSYVRLPELAIRMLDAVDAVLAGLPLLRGWADHRLLLLVRK